jgi:quinol monooxygenase YgiN
MSEYSGCKEEDFKSLTESYKKETKLKKYLNTPKMKKLHKEAMKLQGGDKVIKMVKDQAES